MTTLAEQLQKLATSQTQSLLGSRDLSHASFLYNYKEAATYDRQHFYNIGINGLQQLMRRDERFKEFEQSLFSPSSQAFQRFVQTTETNQQLDEAITRFLILLSPFMQLREAHKALEWLVYRYQIHLRNVDALMMCVLPYHDQEPFIMALRMLKLNTNECVKWRWLEPVKKGNMFLARQTLVTHCRAVRGFLGFVCDMLDKHVEVNVDESGHHSAPHLQRVIAFYTQTVLGVLMSGPPSESILSALIPSITTGLKSHDLPDRIVSSYMILGHLLMHTDLNGSLLKSFLNVIAKNIQPSLLNNALMVIIIMFQKQSISKVAKKAFKYLSKLAALPQTLADLSKVVNTEPFLTPFLETLTHHVLKECGTLGDSTIDGGGDQQADGPLLSLLMDVLKVISLEHQSVAVVARTIISWFIEMETESMEVDGHEQHKSRAFKVFQERHAGGVFKVFRFLENKYSSILEKAVEEITAADATGQTKKVVRNLYKLSVCAARKDLTSDPVTFLTVCLHHRNSSVRKSAVEQLLHDMTLMEDKQAVQSALALRLQDHEPGVVQAVLQAPQKLWDLFDDKPLLYQGLLQKLQTLGGKSEISPAILSQVLQTLCHVPEAAALPAEVTVIVLSFLFPNTDGHLALAEGLLKSPVTSWNTLLAHVARDWLPEVLKITQNSQKTDIKQLAQLCHKLVQTVAHHFDDHAETCLSMIKSLYDSLTATPQRATAALLLLLVTEMLSQQNSSVGHVSERVRVQLQHQLVHILSDLFLNKCMVQSSTHKSHSIKGVSTLPANHAKSLEDRIEAYLSHVPKELSSLPNDIIIDILSRLEWAPVPCQLQEVVFWNTVCQNSLEADWLQLMTAGVNFLLDLAARKSAFFSTPARQLCETFFKVFGDAKSVVKFLCMLWTCPPVDRLTSVQQANVLQFSQVYFTSLTDVEVLSVFNETTPVLPCLLILMSNKCERVRGVAFSILASLARETVDDASSLRWLAASLLQYREEVTKDCEFLAQVLKNILEGESEVTMSPAKKRRRASSKLPPQTAALNYLLNLIGSSDVSANTKAKLLAVLHQLDTAESFLSLVPLLRHLLARTGETPASSDFIPQGATQEITATEREMIGMLLKRFTPAVAGCVDSSTDALPALLAALSCTTAGADGGDTVQALAASRLKKRLMGSLPAPSRQAIFSQLLYVLTSNSDTEMGKHCKKAIKRMALESSIIIEELKPILAISGPGTIREAKRMKHKQTSELDSPPWQRAVILLELIQNKKNVTNAVSLVPVMFQVLGRVLELEDKGSGEYIKQLVLGAVNYICERHQAQPAINSQADIIRGEHLNMDLIVQCIRSSDNPHTHHQALLLLCVAAKISPDLLLHNMMTVFTFMGANILRQDDAYSFHVIGKILENVIPALIMACEEKSKDKVVTRKTPASSGPSTGQHSHTEDMMTAVLRVFVDAIPHIPAHRKMMLFEKLLNVVGVEKYFWRLILLFIESITVRSSRPALDEPADTVPEEDKSSGPVTTSDLEFLTSLADKFSGCQLLQSLNQALNYALHLPEEKQNDGQEDEALNTSTSGGQNATAVEIFSVFQHSAKQLRHFKFALVFVLNHLVSSQHLIAQLAGESSSTFLPGYQGLMETILQFIGQVSQSHQRHKDEQSSRFWRLLRNKSHDLLDQLVSLLPDHLIMDVVLGLMSHSLPLVQRRAMDLLNSKLQHYKDGLTPNQMEMLLSVTKKLQTIVRHCLLKSSKKSGGEEENIINGQTALYSLKILCRILGQRNHQRFIEVLKTCVKVMSQFKHNSLVIASAMLSVAEVVSSVNVHSIEHLGEFMPLVISQLQSEDIIRHEVLLLASVTSLQKIIEAVPMFLSPYLKDIIVRVCVISSVMESQAESQKPALIQKVKMICTTLATGTPTRTFLPVLEKCLSALDDRLALCAENAMCMLKEHIVKMAREDLTTFSQDLLKFFLSCFEIRVNKPEISEEDLNLIEGKLIEAFVALVFKLSEAQFKPMLLQMYGWATAEGVSHDRVLVFYRTCDSLAEKLKSLFTLFAGHIIKHSAEMLDTNNQSKTSCEYFGQGPEAQHKSCQLLCFILGCLHKTFSSDTDGFLNKERFDAVMQPLVDQLDNDLGQDSESEDRITNHLVPCLASLAAAARDDTLWKDLNYQICLKTRHENPKVRIWALSAIDAFHKQLGEDYTHLVPETIPFMAELMEDESDEVEKFTQKVLAAMEVSVGENLQEYF